MPDGLPLWCKQCAHAWVAPLRMPMPVDRFVKVVRALAVVGCPACGAHGKDVLWDTRPAPPPA